MLTNLPFLIEEDGQAIVFNAGRYIMTDFAAKKYDVTRATLNGWARKWEITGEQCNGWPKVMRLGRSGNGSPWWVWEGAIVFRKQTGYHPKYNLRIRNANKGHNKKKISLTVIDKYINNLAD